MNETNRKRALLFSSSLVFLVQGLFWLSRGVMSRLSGSLSAVVEFSRGKASAFLLSLSSNIPSFEINTWTSSASRALPDGEVVLHAPVHYGRPGSDGI